MNSHGLNENYIFLLIISVSPGENNIVHSSQDSSVTIPYERSFRRVGSQFQPTNTSELTQFQFCGCGWPDHMLLPKGTAAGTKFDIFVMVSDYEQDRVDQTTDWLVFDIDFVIFL